MCERTVRALSQRLGEPLGCCHRCPATPTARVEIFLLAGLYTFVDLPFHAKRLRRRSVRKAAMNEEEGGTDTAAGNPAMGAGGTAPATPAAATA